MRALAMLLVLSTIAPVLEAGSPAPGPRRTVAVAPFSLTTDFMADPAAAGLGGALSALLTTALAESHAFLVLERVEADGQQPPAVPAHQLLVLGTVTEFSEATRQSGFTLGLGIGSSRLGLSPQSVTGTVGIDIRAVDTVTNQVVAALSVRESFKARGVSASLERNALSLTRSGSERTPLGQAARRAAAAAVRRLEEALAGREWSGRVVDVEGGEVSINAGAGSGVRLGDRFEVYRTTKVLTDPDTGKVLGQRRRAVGTVSVTAVDANVAFGVFTPGGDVLPQRGDQAVYVNGAAR